MDQVLDVAIIGAGLTGFSLAYNLKKMGNDNFALIEARDRLGGRIHTLTTEDGTKVEMGATWYFPHFNELLKLLKELKIDIEEQYSKGSTFYETSADSPPRKVPGGDEGMYRIKGGTNSIINSLADRVGRDKVHLSKVVAQIRLLEGQDLLEVITNDGDRYKARRVVTTIPPQLLAASVTFLPELPPDVINVASNTHTWMGDAMKGAVTYKRPFWKEANLSGALYSNSGPFVQMYDQSSNIGESQYALVGFMDGISGLPTAERKRRTLKQLQRIFGPEAANSLTYNDTDWTKEEFTMPTKKTGRLYRHSNNGHSVYQKDYFGGRLFIGGTETSSHAGGYMEGAVYSAKSLAKRLQGK